MACILPADRVIPRVYLSYNVDEGQNEFVQDTVVLYLPLLWVVFKAGSQGGTDDVTCTRADWLMNAISQ